MKKSATVKDALRKACVHKRRPTIPEQVCHNFLEYTHCEIWSYHQKIKYPRKNGKSQKTNKYNGIIFIFLLRRTGERTPKPIRIIHKEKMARRDFATYAKNLTDNTHQVLLHALSNKSMN